MSIERRFLHTGELRAEGQGDKLSLIGYAARWGTLSEPLGGRGGGSFRETLTPGCFARSLQSDRSDVQCLMNHDPSLILGRQKNKSLSVSEDGNGLRFRCNVANTSVGRDVFNLVRRGDIADCSFSFQVDGADGDNWTEVDDPDDPDTRTPLRTIIRARLFDVSVVASPAYQGTSVSSMNPHSVSSMPRSMMDYFPQGVPQSFPVEVRSRIMSSQSPSSRAALARQRAIALMLS